MKTGNPGIATLVVGALFVAQAAQAQGKRGVAENVSMGKPDQGP